VVVASDRDGKKRVAFGVMVVFLESNRLGFDAEETEFHSAPLPLAATT